MSAGARRAGAASSCRLFVARRRSRVLVGLGIWQLERKAWKEDLIATLDARLAAPPRRCRRASWPRLDAASGRIPPRRLSRRVRRRRGGAGLYRRLGVPARRDRPRLLGVRAGAARRRQHRRGQSRLRAARRARQRDAARRRSRRARSTSSACCAGRSSAALFTPHDEPQNNLWFARDPAAMAAREGLGRVGAVLRRAGGAGAARRAAQARQAEVQLPDNHLQYARHLVRPGGWRLPASMSSGWFGACCGGLSAQCEIVHLSRPGAT